MLFSRRRTSISNPTSPSASASASTPAITLSAPATASPTPTPSTYTPSIYSLSPSANHPTVRRKSISSVFISPRKHSPPPKSPECAQEADAIRSVLDDMEEVVRTSGVDCSVGRCVGVLRGIFDMFKHNHETQKELYLFRLLRDRIDSFKLTIFDRVFTSMHDSDHEDEGSEFGLGNTMSESREGSEFGSDAGGGPKKEIEERFAIGKWRYDQLETDLQAYLQRLKKHPKNYTEFTHVLNHMNMSGVSIAVNNERERTKGKGRATSTS